MKHKKLLLAAAVAAAMVVAAPSQAGLLLLGQTETFHFGGTGSIYDLFSDGTIQLTGLTSSTATLLISLQNTSDLTGGGAINPPSDARLTAWGFGVDPDATGVTFVDAADGGMISASLDSIPSLKVIEVCAFGGVNCPGGSNGGLAAGASDTFQLLPAGSFNPTAGITIDPLGEKFQTANGSFEFAATCETITCGGNPPPPPPPPPPGQLPTPATLPLALAGLFGIGFIRRKQS